jgi:hypothetical protein
MIGNIVRRNLMKKCQMLGVLLTGLLSNIAVGASAPPGYPDDAEYKTPDSETKKFYHCNNSFGDNGKWPLDVCWDKFSASSDKV